MFLEIIGTGGFNTNIGNYFDPKVFYSNKYFSAVVDYFNLTNSNQISIIFNFSDFYIFFKTYFSLSTYK